MNTRNKIPVIALQFGSGTDIMENMSTCLRMLVSTQKYRPNLIVLPEFVNHISWYNSQDHCSEVALDLQSKFLREISNYARLQQTNIVINVTLKKYQSVTASSLLYGADGNLLIQADKQVLIGHENDYLLPAQEISPLADLDFGIVGLYSCMDGVLFETPRCLALRGAQILCNSLNSFASDEGGLHIPVRAAENRVFVVAANKVGPLVPPEEMDGISGVTGIPKQFLCGAGESQIVDHEGTILAMAPVTGEAIVYAEIYPDDALDKYRSNGTEVFLMRRPDVYLPIAKQESRTTGNPEAALCNAAVYQPSSHGTEGLTEIEDLLASRKNNQIDFLVLPELAMEAELPISDWKKALKRSQEWYNKLCILSSGNQTMIATSYLASVQGKIFHRGILVQDGKILLSQDQIHHSGNLPCLYNHGNSVNTVQTPFGTVAIVVGEDSIIPETTRLAALQGAQIVLVPFHCQENWEVSLGLFERAAENRIGIVAATRPSPMGSSLIVGLSEDYTLMTPWEKREFDGRLSAPPWKRASNRPGLCELMISAKFSENKILSSTTDVVESRPRNLLQPLISEVENL